MRSFVCVWSVHITGSMCLYKLCHNMQLPSTQCSHHKQWHISEASSNSAACNYICIGKYRGADKSLAQPGRKQATSMSQSSWMMDPTRSREMPSGSAIDLAKIRQSSKISLWIWLVIARVFGLRTYQHPSTIFMMGCEVTATLNTILLNVFFRLVLKKYSSFTLQVICHFIIPGALIIWYSDDPYVFDFFNTFFLYIFNVKLFLHK
jgi:hypothetical protein